VVARRESARWSLTSWWRTVSTFQHSLALFQSVPGTWLPFALIGLASWSTGVVLSMMPGGVRQAGPSVSR
jgi:hypothetical protein